MKYFIFNKSVDYERGYMENCCWKGDALVLSEGCGEGRLISRILDSREKGTVWHRFTQSAENSFGAFTRILLYAGEKRRIIREGEEWSLDEVIRSEAISFEDKLNLFAPFLQAELNNPMDHLLFDIKGRYLWFVVKLQAGEETLPGLRDATFYFPKETWLKYLPEVYAKNDESRQFLERYLGIFQSVYDDMDREIRQDASLLDAESATDEFLGWIAGWLDIGNTYLWSRDKLRRLISRSASLFELRGTKKGLLEIITLYTGEEPLLVEEWQTRELRKAGSQKEELERLYGREPNIFTLLLKEEYLSSSRDYQVISSLAKVYAPAYMEVNIVPIKPFIFLGEYTYLGINSGLGQYRPLKLDGLSVLPYTAIGGEIQEGEQQ